MSILQDMRDAFRRRDNAVTQYIILNVLVFAALIVVQAVLVLAGHRDLNSDPIFRGIMRQLELSSDLGVLLRHPWTPLTYAFTHKDPFHILFNMLNLYWFGRLIQEYLGSRRFVSIYLLGALTGAAVYLLTYNVLPAFAGAGGVGLIGASAAVVAVLIAAATLLPDYTFMLLFIGAVRIKYIALFVILVLSVKPIYEGNPGGGLAHLGGALLGFVFIKQMQAGRDLGAPLHAVGRWISRLFERRPSGPARPASYTSASTSATSATSSRTTNAGTSAGVGAGSRAGTGRATTKAAPPATEDVDAILDKISRSGYESLSKEEKQRLFRASQQ